MTPVALVVTYCAGCIFLRAWHWLYTASFSDVSLSTSKGRRNGASWRDVPFPAFFHFLWFSTRVSLEASVKEAGPGGSHTFLCGCDYFSLLVLQGLLGTSESQLRQREIKDLLVKVILRTQLMKETIAQHTWNLMTCHSVFKSITSEQVKTNPGCYTPSPPSALTGVGLWYPDLLQTLHTLARIIPK